MNGQGSGGSWVGFKGSVYGFMRFERNAEPGTDRGRFRPRGSRSGPGKALEKAVVVPRRPGGRIGDPAEQPHDHVIELRRGFDVDRLLQVVRGLVVDVADPVAADLLLRRSELVAELERQ